MDSPNPFPSIHLDFINPRKGVKSIVFILGMVLNFLGLAGVPQAMQMDKGSC